MKRLHPSFLRRCSPSRFQVRHGLGCDPIPNPVNCQNAAISFCIYVLRQPSIMQLRNHPLLTRKSGTKAWPPMWTSPRGDENDKLVGEIGILQQLSIGVLVDTSLFLFIDYQGSRYMGLLYF